MAEQTCLDFDPESSVFERDRHVLYLQMMYQLLPSAYQGQEINRLTLAYFVVCGLNILSALDRIDKEEVINWVLSLQAHPKNRATLESGQFYGFHGSRSSQFQSNDTGAASLNGSHLASTYCALAILKTVGYDLSLIDAELLLRSMKNLQQADGCFIPIHTGGEADLRFVYCAAAICSMLNNWSGMDREKAKEYIINCQSYDGGFGLIPGSESHGGATYCAVASLKLMGFLEEDLPSKNICSHIINVPLLLDWSLQYGGFSKLPRSFPDLYHSYYGFCAFSLLNEPGVGYLCVELGIADVAVLGHAPFAFLFSLFISLFPFRLPLNFVGNLGFTPVFFVSDGLTVSSQPSSSETAQRFELNSDGLNDLRFSYADLCKNPVDGFSAGLLDESNLFEWSVTIIGPPDTLYEGGFFNAIMTFPSNYPNSPPTVRFTSEIWHPNVYSDGKVCISILHPPGDDPNGYELASERWSPVHTVESIVLSIISMLSSPNDESPANVEAAFILKLVTLTKEWREHRDDFKKKVSRCVRKSQEML
ncbi:ubiquitin-conjugating enzyme E2 [Striga asiatica]|uniref:E2 ubiquitin-conjugating enzyme n=1 Tax=Striga asiatica TaxID=4170 RepID=A0A5A7P0X6_STRAF|nr:ubiquitin-conjugating enzyme E2 [Striga asiatica]